MKTKKRSLSARLQHPLANPLASFSKKNKKNICSLSTFDISTGISIPITKTSNKKSNTKQKTSQMFSLSSRKQKTTNTSLNPSKTIKKQGTNSILCQKLHNYVDQPDFDIHIDEAIIKKSGRNHHQKSIDLKLKQKTKKQKKNMSRIKGNKAINEQNLSNLCFLSARESLTNIKELNEQSNISPIKQDKNMNINEKMENQKGEIIHHLTKLNQNLQKNIMTAYQKQSQTTISHQKQMQKMKQENGMLIAQKQSQIKELFQRIKQLEEESAMISKHKEKCLDQIQKLKQCTESDHKILIEAATTLQRKVQDLTYQLENKKLEFLELLSQKKSQQQQLERLNQQLCNSEQQNNHLTGTIKQFEKNIWDLKAQMNLILKQNCQLRERINKNHQQKQYIQDNLFTVLGAVRNSMNGCQIPKNDDNSNQSFRFGNDVMNTTKL